MILPLLLFLQVTTAPDGAIVVASPPPAIAQTPATIVVEPAAMFVAGCDANGDALVSRTELTDCVARSFAGAEGGKTGSIRFIAYGDWALRWLGDRTALPSPYDVDRDGDNVVTLAELQSYFARLFSRYDKDHDGDVTRADLLTFKARAIDANGPVGGNGPPDRHGKPRR